jgi:transposase
MLKMPQQQYIKFLREVEGLNISEISENMDINWRTAKKYADRDDWNQLLAKRNRLGPVMKPYQEIVDTWLEGDRLLPKKQRHTAIRIYNRLCQEHSFTGSYRTVSSYVLKRKAEMNLEKAKAYERLEHPGGEAQVDFCSIQVSLNSVLQEYKLLLMAFPFSNTVFVQPMPSENQECFLEGLKLLFKKAGGVPSRIWFDNLSAAVALNKNGERKQRELFTRFSCHYRFEAIFCNPNSGNEKGHVESKCGYSRRNWCVPVPVFESHEKLSADLDALATGDMNRPHYLKGRLIRELWDEEAFKLNRLPDVEFEVYRLNSAVVNKYGEVQADKTSITVFGAKPGDEMLLRLWWDRIDVLNRDYQALTSVPRPYTAKQYDIPWLEVFKSFLRKPRSVQHSQFTKFLPDVFRDYLRVNDLQERKKRIAAVINWSSIYTIDEITGAIEQLDNNATVTAISGLLSLPCHPVKTCVGFPEPYTPEQLRGVIPDLARYNTLVKGGEKV